MKNKTANANNTLIYNESKYKVISVSVGNQSGQMKRLSLTKQG